MFLGNISNAESLVHISMMSVNVSSDIKVNNITILQRSSVWDSVTDNLINGGATTAREIIIVQA